MTEKQYEEKVKAYLRQKGCWVLKTWSNGIQREGIPDLLVCCNGYFLGIELKAQNGHPSALQTWNIKMIREAGGVGIILYPDQFDEFTDMIDIALDDIPDELYAMQFIFDRKGDQDEWRAYTN